MEVSSDENSAFRSIKNTESDIPTQGILDDTGTRKLIAIKARSLNLIAVFDL